MAMCPKCFKHNKEMFAEHCPDCTHRTSVGDQIQFSASVTVGTILLFVFLGWLIFG